MIRRSHPILEGIEAVAPYKLVTAAKLNEVTPPPMQIEDFLPVGGVMGLTSQPGVGKTWLGLEVVRAVSSGTLFLNRFKSLRGGVLFVGNDSSIYDYARQWRRLTRTVEDPHAFDPVRFLIQDTFLFEDRDEVRRLIRSHQRFEWGEVTFGDGNKPQRERGFHVIVFDTLSALTNVPESDNTGREQVFRMVRLIAEVTDCAVVVLHHNAARSEYNDGEGFRGATSQLGRLDSHVNLRPVTRANPYLIGVTYKKFRGIKPQNFAYEMNVNDPLTATLTASSVPADRDQRYQRGVLSEDIVAHVTANPGCHPPAIADALLERYRAGVEDHDGKTLSFKTRVKLKEAVDNRLAALRQSGAVHRDDAKGYHAGPEPAGA